MDYLMTFLEGLLSFISPCVLPMVPIYITYLLGESAFTEVKCEHNFEHQHEHEHVHVKKTNTKNKEKDCIEKSEIKKSNKKLYFNSIFFILGFAIVFMTLGLFSSVIGGFLVRYKFYINVVFGVILLIFGFNFLGLLKFTALNKEKKIKGNIKTFNILSSFVFGLLFALSWTPCVGPFLASAMMRAAATGTALSGSLLLLVYALGIGIPFFLSAVFLAKLKSTFNFIKKHYKVVNIVSGIIIIVLGVLKIFNIY